MKAGEAWKSKSLEGEAKKQKRRSLSQLEGDYERRRLEEMAGLQSVLRAQFYERQSRGILAA